MKNILLVLCAATFMILGSRLCVAQSADAKAQAAVSPAPAGYVPPVRGAPSRRVGGSSRGGGDELPTISALVPDHMGLTTSEKPVLYWYLSKPTSARIEITLIDESGLEPLIEVSAGTELRPGVHAVRLADYGVALTPGVEYEWSVALVLDAEERSTDIISAGAIQRVRTGAYAPESVWYDAVAALSQAIDEDVGSHALRALRASMLEQAGLAEPAAYDRAFADKLPKDRP